MREIKFRACDTKNNHVWEINERLHLQLQGNSWKIVDIDFGSQRWSSWNDPHIILSQYTGLKDKNGKGIYEGDILRRKTGYIFEVRLITWRSGRRELLTYDIIADKDEIIGNIYENKDLIEEAE